MLKTEAATKALSDLLTAMRSLTVTPLPFPRADLLHMHHEREMPFRLFASQVCGQTKTCALKQKCRCGQDVDYTDHSICDVLLRGISDRYIQREALAPHRCCNVIALVSNKEITHNTLPLSSPTAVSLFRHQQKEALIKSSPTLPPRTDQRRSATTLENRKNVSQIPRIPNPFAMNYHPPTSQYQYYPKTLMSIPHPLIKFL